MYYEQYSNISDILQCKIYAKKQRNIHLYALQVVLMKYGKGTL